MEGRGWRLGIGLIVLTLTGRTLTNQHIDIPCTVGEASLYVNQRELRKTAYRAVLMDIVTASDTPTISNRHQSQGIFKTTSKQPTMEIRDQHIHDVRVL